MMSRHRPRVLLTSILDRRNPVLLRAQELVGRFPPAAFDAVDGADADVVLYLEHGYIGLAELPRLLRRVREHPRAKHLVFSESDWPYAVLPGAYPSLTVSRPWACSWAYISAASQCDAGAGSVEPDLLFSFLGRVSTHAVRSDVVRLDSAATPCLDVADAPRRFPSFDYRATYADLLRRSRFVLCPRGFGASSIRIFETMAAGRVPVIISDAWQPPPDVPWAECSVRIAEQDVRNIPSTLAHIDARAAHMGSRARDIYTERFGSPVFLDRLLSAVLAVAGNRGTDAWTIVSRAWSVLSRRELRTFTHQARTLAAGGSRGGS